MIKASRRNASSRNVVELQRDEAMALAWKEFTEREVAHV